MMRIGRTLPPAAAPITFRDLGRGLAGLGQGRGAVSRFEREVREHFGVRYAFAVSSGTGALALTLQAMAALSPRREVIVPAYTCFSVPAAVLHAGLDPVPVDIDPTTFDFDLELLRTSLSERTLAVVAHHLFGAPADIDGVRRLCQARGIFVVEDAAQAMGVEVDGRQLGTLGDAGIFSLGRGKNITCGSGGIAVTDSPRIGGALERTVARLPFPGLLEGVADLGRLAMMAVFIRPSLYWMPAAIPFLRLGETIFPESIELSRLSPMKARLLHGWRTRLGRSNEGRLAVSQRFTRDLCVGRRPHPYLRFPLLLPSAAQRDALHARAKRQGLGITPAYPTSIDAIPRLQRTWSGRRFPAAERVAERLLTLPTHHWLTDDDRREIADLCQQVPAA
jgi:dTDP-4-amino-4,6-dideoxygalactose transaminase